MNDESPATEKVMARDVRAGAWAVWCTAEGYPGPFANEIVHVSWMDDGRVSFMLGTHNFLTAAPDELVELVPIRPPIAKSDGSLFYQGAGYELPLLPVRRPEPEEEIKALRSALAEKGTP